jgi:beta-1,3-galactosyltransferase 1/2/3/4/5/7/8
MSFNKGRGGGEELVLRGTISKKWTFLLCLGSFCIGLLFTNRCKTPCFFFFSLSLCSSCVS